MADGGTVGHANRLGIVIRLWLVYVALAGLWTAYRFGNIIEDLVSHDDPRWTGNLAWALPALLGLSLANVVGAGLLLLRLIFGFYLIMLVSVASVVIALMVATPLQALLPGLIGLAVLVILVQRNSGALR